jgi:hypothetical protein
MGAKYHTGRSACRHIFRALATRFGKFASIVLTRSRVLKSLHFKLNSMIQTTKPAMHCSLVSRFLSLKELDIGYGS